MKKIFITLLFSLFAVFSFAQQIDRHLVLIEIATGTWCYYCPGAAMGADDLHENGDPVAIIENHSSDAFANTYSNARNSYNGVNGIPQANFDGSYNSVVGGNHTQSLYSTYLPIVNARMNVQTSYDIAIDGYHDGNDYYMTVSVTKVADDNASNLKVQLALTESDIQYNWQGQTELNFVNRLMVPGASGTSVSFSSVGETIDVDLNFTFDNEWDLNNCDLVAFIQDDGTKENMNAITMALPDVPLGMPTADFEGTPTSGYVPLTVQFTDLSSGQVDSWSWDFGDGETSTEQNPEHTYNAAGTYTVSLTVTGGAGSDTHTITDYIEVIPIPPPPTADFTADVTEGPAPLNVHFTDLSEGVIDDWSWDFDGGWSGQQNPTYMFMNPGVYTITLTVTGPGGSGTEVKTDYITVTEPVPEPDFEADQTYGPVPLTVNFTDLTPNTVDSWLWDFGDGETSTEQNPQHIYTEEDYFTVSLTVTGPGGTNTITKVDYINTGNLLGLDVTADPDTICLGATTQLDAGATGGSGDYTYSWTSDPEGFTSDEENPEVSPEVTTIYFVEVNDGEQIASGEITVFVNPLPEITLGDWPEDLCHSQEPPVQLTATPEGGTYSGNAVTEDGIFSPEEAPLGWNVITYTYTDENGCENSAVDSVYVDDCVGIVDVSIDGASVTVYPNPNNGTFKISSDQTINKVVIRSMTGKMIYTGTFSGKEINMARSLVQGVYLIQIFVQDNQNSFRIITKQMVVN